LPAAPLVVRRTYLIVVPRPVPRPLPAATRRCRNKKRKFDVSTKEEHSADETAVVCHRYVFVVPRPLLICPLSWNA
jgi:hypothetical protein